MGKYTVKSDICGRTYILVFLFLLVKHADAACTWPAVFDGTWLDSQQGQIVFTSSSDVSGFELVFYSHTVNTFTCIEDQFETNKKLLIRSVSSASAIGGDWYHYICLKFTELTVGVSYTYYRLNEQQADAGQHRTKPRLIIIDDAEFTIDNACDETKGAKDAEFVTIIKQGSETDAYITCPSVLLGRFEFNYTNSAGTESCNDPSNQEHMNVCTDKTKLTFDVPCTGQSIVYASGDVYCVASLQVGSDTFVQLYNPQATVDSSSTYRFSCLAISSDSLSSTIVYNNCTNHQTSSYVPRKHNGDVIGASISFLPYVFCKGGCIWPAAFVSSTWRDNTRGDITFDTDTLQGWSIQMYGSTVSNWECLDQSYFDSEGILIIKSTDTFSHVGGTWTSFVCLEMTKVTDNSYYYYQKHDQLDSGGSGDERVKSELDGTITGKSNICGSTAVPTAEFHFMVKSGSESASKQYCSPSLLAKMDYTLDTLGVETCAGTVDDWDVCTNRTTMTFNYTTCVSEMLYSSGGEVYCMVNLTSTHEYTVVYNTDASPTYRFACIVSNSAGTEASIVYKNCTIDQTPTTNAKQHDGTNIGALVTMEAKETCPFLGPTSAASTSSESGSILPIIIGAVFGILAIAVVIAILIYCFKCKKRSEVNHNDTEKRRLPDDGDNTNPALNETPAGRHTTLTPLPPKHDVIDNTPRPIPPITNHV